MSRIVLDGFELLLLVPEDVGRDSSGLFDSRSPELLTLELFRWSKSLNSSKAPGLISL